MNLGMISVEEAGGYKVSLALLCFGYETQHEGTAR